ncbi:hypothetical protein [Crocinitomix algicola]|uniref:hypothetical protein n=1 Tax=Crocinitomix algicola TaxID=1740263 RepID=UPI0008354165|nr:hypothetical protein [Crocinitomix algicola]
MKLKGLLGTFILTLLMGGGVFAQEETTESGDDCAQMKSLYYRYLQQKMYNDAAMFWTKAIDACGTDGLDAKFYFNGRYLYSKLEKEEGISEERIANINDTMNIIYERRMLVENDPSWTADYAAKLMSDKSEDIDKIDSLFGASIHTLKADAKSTHIIQYFKHLLINKFNKAEPENKEEARTMVIEEYITLSEYVSTAKKAAEKAADKNEVKRQTSAQNFIDKYFLKVANDCDVLVGVFKEKLNTLPQEIEAKKKKVNNYLGLMDQKKCQSNEVYGMFVDTLISIDPTADAYFFGGSYASSTDNHSKAVEYFQKAVELEADGENKNKYLLSLANEQYKARSYRSAFNTAKTVGAGEYQGDALMICANSIAATANDCGESTFARKANNWLANVYVQRAIAAGKTGVSSGKFLDRAPSVNEAFDEGVSEGNSVSLSCWGESVTAKF